MAKELILRLVYNQVTPTPTPGPSPTPSSTPTPTPTPTPTVVTYDYSCGDGTQQVFTGSDLYGTYDLITVDATDPSNGTFYWTSQERPNRFTLYDDTSTVYTTGWVGIANYSGPWGSSLNTSINGNTTFTWTNTSGRTIQIEYGPSGPPDYLSDAANYSIVCGT